MPTPAQVIVWLIVGGLAGALVGAIVTGKRSGYGFWTNLLIGLGGALLGGLVFHAFKIDLGLGQIAFRLEDLVAAVLGCFVVVVLLKFLRKRRKPLVP
jgi:uncharacterized membrane protein YeaQ/YmgE (transglycosylase-associated protein family)